MSKVRVLFADHLNLARGKYLPVQVARRGTMRMARGLYGVTYDKALLPAPGTMVLEGIPDCEAVFDIDARPLRPSWENADDRVVVADVHGVGDRAGPLPMCGRSQLRGAVAAWRQLGYEPKVGIELEATVFQRDADGRWVPYDTPGAYVYGTGPMVDPAGLMDAVWSEAERCGFPLEAINSEYDASQFEMTLRYTDAVQAVDDIFLFRVLAREVIAKRGYWLSFLPKPIADLGGIGFHVNLSLARDGANAFGDGVGRDALSPLVSQCVAGMMRHHRGMTALLAPTLNSYQRLQPASMAGYWQNWAFDHRGVTVRIADEAGEAARLEHRLADCAANPYTAVATVLHAARLGVVNQYDLQPEETADCLENVDATVAAPDSLPAALDALQADTALVEALGPAMVDHFVFMKRDEVERTAGLDERARLDYYFPFL